MDTSADNDSQSSADPSVDEITENFCGPTKDILAEGFIRLFKPVIDKLDQQVLTTRSTQIEIEQKVNLLHESLSQIYQTPHQTILDEYVSKLENIKNKITVISNIMQASQDRLSHIRPLVVDQQQPQQ
jgi:SNARE-associated protein Snapin